MRAKTLTFLNRDCKGAVRSPFQRQKIANLAT
jgi:hypothetical protein